MKTNALAVRNVSGQQEETSRRRRTNHHSIAEKMNADPSDNVDVDADCIGKEINGDKKGRETEETSIKSPA